MEKAKRIGVVLSSGGGPGVFAHTGFLLALEKMGIKPAAIAGCSAGALVGGVYASGTSIRNWAEALKTIKPEAYWKPDTPWQFLWSMTVQKGRGYTGLSDTNGAIEVIADHLKARTFEACSMPFYSLAINLTHEKKTLFSSGELAPRIMASAAIPAFYRPVEIDGQLYSDGAVIGMTPTEAICCKHHLDAVIIHYIAPEHPGPKGLEKAMNRSWTIVEIIQRLLHHEKPWYLSGEPVGITQCRCGCKAPFYVIEAELDEMEWPPEKGGQKILKSVFRQTRKLLEPHRTFLVTDDQSTSKIS